ncbi:MAG: hypothetical protein GWO24_23270 [Akkermansiaceae bacterium]|nr:hypothetical protein [Akkermansiaceae bacterium]
MYTSGAVQHFGTLGPFSGPAAFTRLEISWMRFGAAKYVDLVFAVTGSSAEDAETVAGGQSIVERSRRWIVVGERKMFCWELILPAATQLGLSMPLWVPFGSGSTYMAYCVYPRSVDVQVAMAIGLTAERYERRPVPIRGTVEVSGFFGGLGV